MLDGSYRMGMCGDRCNRNGRSLDKGPKEGMNMWALGQGEVTGRTGGQGGCEAGSGLSVPSKQFGFHPWVSGSSPLRSLTPSDSLGKLHPLSVEGKCTRSPTWSCGWNSWIIE